MPGLNTEAQIKITTTADTSGVKEAESSLGGFGDSLQNIGEIAAALGLEQLTEKIVELGKAAAEFSISSASNIEQTRITMDAFTGSVEKGQKAMEILNAFSRSAPLLPIQDVFQGGEQILGFGFGLDQLNDKLKVAGELSVAAHTPLSVAIDLLARAKEGIFNLREFGQFGISAQELTKFGVQLKETGKVVSITNKDQLLPALEKLANTKFGTIFQKETGTFAGAVQNIKDDMVRLSAAFLGVDENGNVMKNGVFAMLEKEVNAFYNFIESHKDEIVAFFNGFLAVMNKIGSYIVQIFTPVMDSLEDLYKRHQKEIDILAKFLGTTLLGAIIVVITFIAAFIEGLITVITWLFDLGETLGKLVNQGIYLFISALQTLGSVFSNVWNTMKAIALDVANSIIGVINGIIDTINTFIQGAVSLASHASGVKISLPTINHISNVGGGGNNAVYGPPAPSNTSNINIYNTNSFSNATDISSFSRDMAWQLRTK